MKIDLILRLTCAIATLSLSACDSGSSSSEPPETEPEIENSSVDTMAPEVSLVGNDSIEVAFNALFQDLGATAVDDVDGELTVSVDGAVDTSLSGEYELVYSATDSSGNLREVSRTVTVLEDPSLTTTVSTPDAAALFFDGVLVEADYWSETPEILSAGMGFADIVGLDTPELTIDIVREAGGSWAQDISCAVDSGDYTMTSTQDQVASVYKVQTPYVDQLKDGALGMDGLPIVFSWPVDTRTMDLTDFQFTLNTGDIVRPLAISTWPNVETNERNTVVVFGEFGNRLPSTDSNSRFPVRLDIVEDDTPLLMVGPNAQVVSAVGLSWETDSSPYDENNGPRLVGAKLNRIDGPLGGEGVNTPVPLAPANDHTALYSEGDFMLRMLTSGGFSPDGVRGIKPNEFERFFRIHATGEDGNTVIIDEVNLAYAVQGGTLRVVGLSELGQREGGDVYYDDCYDEDMDNYIDIILVGDEAAARSIEFLEIPSLEGGYSAFYNPGGPGSTPFEGVTYTEPGPADLEPVIIALDDPMRVSYGVDSDDGGDTGNGLLTVDVDGVTREYLLTVPDAYTGDEAVPLLFDFHGLNGTAQGQFADSQLDRVAEQENFILVTPQAIDGVWAITGFPVASDADDAGFVDALIDSLSGDYNVDQTRVYATGMSLGGFLSQELVCDGSHRFAAIAPVSGVLTPDLQQACSPARPIPVLQTHGTADNQIPYDAAVAAVQFWVGFNQANSEPLVEDLPDPFPANGTSVQRLTYVNSETGVNVEHLRIEGGGHVWPGSNGDSDIDMAQEVWRFVSRYQCRDCEETVASNPESGPVGDSPSPDSDGTDGPASVPFEELYTQGVDRYLGMTYATSSSFLGETGTVHSFEGVDGGPLCHTGNEFTMSTRDGASSELMIFVEGGGGCGPTACNAVDRTVPGVPGRGIMDASFPDNPTADFNVGYIPYCDGTLFTGDVDLDTDGDGMKDRFFRGVQNLSASLNMIHANYPAPTRILLAGNSAGGTGVHFALPLVRKLYPTVPIDLVNDSGMGIYEPGAFALLIDYWNAGAVIPESCTKCVGDDGNLTGYYSYQLDQDDNVRMGFMSSRQDEVITQQFAIVDAATFEAELLQLVDQLEASHSERFRGLVIAGDSHTSLQREFDRPVGETTVRQWIDDMINQDESWTSVSD